MRGKRSLHNLVLITINWLVATVMMVSACLLDSEDWLVFLAIVMVCAGYLALYTYVNIDRGGVL